MSRALQAASLVMTRGRAWLLSLALVIDCSHKEQSNAPTLTDSLGIALIEYPTTIRAASERTWSTGPDPLLAIGEPAPEFFRVSTALYLSDGAIAVVNVGSQELLLFDDAGELRARAGGRGGGPGEFRQLSYLSTGPGDSLFAYDDRKRSLSVFDRNGAFARTLALQGLDSLGDAEYVGVLPGGEVVGAFRRPARGVGLQRDSLVVTTFAPSGEPRRSLGVFPYIYMHWGPHAVPGGGNKAAFPLPVPFSGVAAVGLGQAGIYVGLPDPYSLILLHRNGIERVTRQKESPGPVTDALRKQLLAALSSGRMNAQELDMLFDLKGPGTLPAFGVTPLTARVGEQSLLVTDVGGVWLQPFRLPGDSTRPSWPRFDADGFYEGVATMPARFRPTAVRGDVVLGVYRNEQDVESVRAYRLVMDR